MKRNDILKDYYSFTVRFGGRDNSFKERVKNFFKRNNFFGKMNKDIDCLEIAEDIIKDFRRDRYFSEYDYVAYDEDGKNYMAHNHPDPFQLRARNALVNAIVFFLYWEHEPEDFEFIRIRNMLWEAKEDLDFSGFSNVLDSMYEGNDSRKLNHTGKREYDVFKLAAGQGQYKAIRNVLENFDVIIKRKDKFVK